MFDSTVHTIKPEYKHTHTVHIHIHCDVYITTKPRTCLVRLKQSETMSSSVSFRGLAAAQTTLICLAGAVAMAVGCG